MDERLTGSPVSGEGTGVAPSEVRTQERPRGDGRDEGPRRGTAEDAADRPVRDIHIEYKNNRHLNTNNLKVLQVLTSF